MEKVRKHSVVSLVVTNRTVAMVRGTGDASTRSSKALVRIPDSRPLGAIARSWWILGRSSSRATPQTL